MRTGASGVLVVLRGNSGSGKSTVARLVQAGFGPGECLVVPQDTVRRELLGDTDSAGAGDIDLIETIAGWGLARGLVVVVEGILNAGRYQRALERLAGMASGSHFFGWDLPLEETLRRHGTRTKADAFTADEMSDWYHGWQPLDFVTERRFDTSVSAREAADRVLEASRHGGL
ncbi:kinase [Leifsonia shinshuensis]|uniref:Kinase n=1 Tax=Leifsonia shinshuensis TaxID=150026 RepID=A0A7G6Y6D3_9MICO|nr:kinase [Leifsonia shinshuensis]QNE34048.1 kinase [Leifsonia shinshuensis]